MTEKEININNEAVTELINQLEKKENILTEQLNKLMAADENLSASLMNKTKTAYISRTDIICNHFKASINDLGMIIGQTEVSKISMFETDQAIADKFEQTS